MSSVVVYDSFTDTNGTNLTAHTGEKGATWTKVTGALGDLVVQANSACVSGAGVSAVYVSSGVPATNEYDVDGDFANLTTIASNFQSILGRWSTSAKTGYKLQYEVDAGKFVLYVSVAGVETPIGQYIVALGAAQTLHAKLQIRTAAKTVFIQGIAQITSGDDTQTAVGRGGLDAFATTTAPTSSTGLHLDNFLVTEYRTHGLSLVGVG